jgi:protein AATF/BFR2
LLIKGLIENNEDIDSEIKIKGVKKRKRESTVGKTEEYWKVIKEHNDQMSQIEDNWIQFWNDRIKLEENTQNKKKFQALDQSLLSQINHILMEKDRLIKRSQLKRFDENIIGSSLSPSNNSVPLSSSKSKNLDVSEYVPELYDDSDFYQVKKIFESFFFTNFLFLKRNY